MIDQAQVEFLGDQDVVEMAIDVGDELIEEACAECLLAPRFGIWRGEFLGDAVAAVAVPKLGIAEPPGAAAGSAGTSWPGGSGRPEIFFYF